MSAISCHVIVLNIETYPPVKPHEFDVVNSPTEIEIRAADLPVDPDKIKLGLTKVRILTISDGELVSSGKPSDLKTTFKWAVSLPKSLDETQIKACVEGSQFKVRVPKRKQKYKSAAPKVEKMESVESSAGSGTIPAIRF
eukprot:jgi/Tetstr1/423357/TSEL_014050.t1